MENMDVFSEVGKFYDSNDNALLWKVINKDSMHVGYWDDKNMNASIADASNRLTEILIEKSRFCEGDKIIDIGCGYGVAAIEFCKVKGCVVYGVTASQSQCSTGLMKIEKEGLADNVKLFVMDARNLDFIRNDFNGAIGIESFLHIGHLNALCEVFRVLKPNSQLLVTDFILLSKNHDKELLSIMKQFHVSSLLTIDEYRDMLCATGFQNIEIIDITSQTIKMRNKKYTEAFSEYEEELIKTGGIEYYNRMIKYWQNMNTLWEENAGYVIIDCEKK